MQKPAESFRHFDSLQQGARPSRGDAHRLAEQMRYSDERALQESDRHHAQHKGPRDLPRRRNSTTRVNILAAGRSNLGAPYNTDQDAIVNQAEPYSTMSLAIGDADNYTGWIVDVFQPYVGRNLLEIGTGFGNYRQHFPDIAKYTSVDIDSEAIARAAVGDPAGTYVCADASRAEFAARFPEGSFDTVMCANVLEHIPEHEAAAANMFRALGRGGHLLLFVPAHMSLYNDMDRLAGHLRRYTKESLGRVLAPLGGTMVELRYFNSIGGLGWWVNRLRRYDSLNDGAINGQIRFFDKYVVPVSRMVDPLSRGFFGQSLIAVVRK
jgi:SAM-dependent methyltransferase